MFSASTGWVSASLSDGTNYHALNLTPEKTSWPKSTARVIAPCVCSIFKDLPHILLLCTEDDNSSYRNVCKMSVVSFALAVIFIMRLFSTSVFRVPKLIGGHFGSEAKVLPHIDSWCTIQQAFSSLVPFSSCILAANSLLWLNIAGALYIVSPKSLCKGSLTWFKHLDTSS